MTDLFLNYNLINSEVYTPAQKLAITFLFDNARFVKVKGYMNQKKSQNLNTKM